MTGRPAAAAGASRRRRGGRAARTRRAIRLGAALALALAAAPAAVRSAPSALPASARPAQAEWIVDDVGPLRLAYRPADRTAADALRDRLGAMATDLAAALDAALPTPLTLRLYGDVDRLRADHPLARLTDAGLAEEHRPRREAAALVPVGAGGAVDPIGLDAAVRYALAHQILAHAADGRLPGGFQEGLARLVTPPSAATQTGVAALRAAIDRGDLIAWSELSGPGSAYLRPELSYPQSASMAVYLALVHGFDCVTGLPRAAAGDAPFRTAFARACGVPFETAERAWRAWLPSYVDGGWRAHPLYDPSLSLARERMARGDDAGAASLLRAAVAVLDDGPARDAARALQQRAAAGGAAATGLATADAALRAGDYAAVRTRAEDVRQAAAPVGAAGAVNSAERLAELGRTGLSAHDDLRRAVALPPWRVLAARRSADRAARAFAALGNDLAASEAVTVRGALDRRAAPWGWFLLAAGLGLLAHAHARPAIRAWRVRR